MLSKYANNQEILNGKKDKLKQADKIISYHNH